MERILAILTREADYSRELAGFLAAKEEFLYKPIAFSDVGAYLKFESETAVDLLICDRDMEPGERQSSPQKVCILSEYSTVDEDSEGRSSVFKYQSSEKLMHDIMAGIGSGEKDRPNAVYPRHEIPSDRFSAALPQAEPAGRLFRTVGVCSPVGGTRCSTYAFAFADFCSKKSKALFVSLDPFFNVPVTGGTGGGDLTELLYYLETRAADDAPRLEEYVSAGTGADVIKGPAHWLDLENLGKESLIKLADLAERAGYSCAVFDLGRPQNASAELLRLCTDVFVTRRKGKHDEAAIAEWKRQLRSSGLPEIAEKIKERIVPNDKAAEGAIDRSMLLAGSLGGYLKETEEFGYIG